MWEQLSQNRQELGPAFGGCLGLCPLPPVGTGPVPPGALWGCFRGTLDAGHRALSGTKPFSPPVGGSERTVFPHLSGKSTKIQAVLGKSEGEEGHRAQEDDGPGPGCPGSAVRAL